MNDSIVRKPIFSSLGRVGLVVAAAGLLATGACSNIGLMPSVLAAATDSTAAAGAYHSLFVRQNGTLYASGSNASGQLGLPETVAASVSQVPVQAGIPAGQTVVAVSAGIAHSAALTESGALYLWGNNDSGQLGDGTTTASVTAVSPTGLPAGTTVTLVSAGDDFTVAVLDDGTVRAWGANEQGQLGNGTTISSNVPVQVGGLPTGVDITQIYARGRRVLLLTDAGSLYAWGQNDDGQVGDGSTTDRTAAVQVPGTYASIAAGSTHSMALGTDGTLYTWGSNDSGELGDGTTAARASPTAITLPAGVTVSSLGAGLGMSAILTTDGSVYAWGKNDEGQLGDGTTTDRTSPPATPSVTGADTLIVGYRHVITVATTAEGRPYTRAFGANDSGQLGADLVTAYVATPTATASAPTPAPLPATATPGGDAVSATDTGTAATTDDGDGGGGGLTDAEAVAADAAALDIGDFIFTSPDTSTSVRQNFQVPVTGANGSTITWTTNVSSNLSFAADGMVTVTRGPTLAAMLFAAVTKGSERTDKSFQVTIMATDNRAWNSVAMSGDGRIMLASAESTGAELYGSLDYGTTWTKQAEGPLSGKSWNQVDISRDGSILVATGDNNDWWTAMESGEILSWTDRTENDFNGFAWNSIFINDDAHIFAVGNTKNLYYIQAGVGTTANNINPLTAGAITGRWKSVAGSDDGTTMYAVFDGSSDYGIYKSTNSGGTWDLIDTPYPLFVNDYFNCVAADSGGTVVVLAEQYGAEYLSTDGGTNWSSISVGSASQAVYSFAVSGDGSKMIACVSGGSVYRSSDTGTTWTAVTGLPTGNWRDVDISTDGTRMVAVMTSGLLYISTDSGATWTAPTMP